MMNRLYYYNIYQLLFIYIVHTIFAESQDFGHAEISFRFKSFENSGGHLSNGEKCDSFGHFKHNRDYCDQYFEVCMDSKPLKKYPSCNIFYIATPKEAFPNQNRITFGQKIKFLNNPLVKTTDHFASLSRLSVDIFDYDSTSNGDEVDKLFKDLQLNASHWSVPFSNIQPVSVSLTGYTVLYVEIKVRCLKNYYGPSCNKKCVPLSDDYSGHYGCSRKTGVKICLPGWRGDNCDQKDYCYPNNPCMGIGSCINTDTYFKCICPPGVKGNQCEFPVLPCSKPSNCRNNGICYRNQSTNTQSCFCQRGFTGPTCEEDVNECDQQTTPVCLNAGKCRNKFGSYACICADNYSGPDCAIPLLDKALPARQMANNGGHSSSRIVLQQSTIVIMSVLCSLCFVFLVAGFILFYIVRKHRKQSGWNKANSVVKQVRYVRRNSSPRESLYEEVDDGPFAPVEYQMESDGALPQFGNPMYDGLPDSSRVTELPRDGENPNHYEMEEPLKRFDPV